MHQTVGPSQTRKCPEISARLWVHTRMLSHLPRVSLYKPTACLHSSNSESAASKVSGRITVPDPTEYGVKGKALEIQKSGQAVSMPGPACISAFTLGGWVTPTKLPVT